MKKQLSRPRGSLLPIERHPVEHPLLAVSCKLMAEFPGQALKVFHVVADCADNDLDSNPSLVERAARDRLTAMVDAQCDSEQQVPFPRQSIAN